MIGVVFNIQRFSVHDGPGIRDLVLMKGCPLRCRWCSNPESQDRQPEISINEGRCIGFDECGRCITACPANAATKLGENRVGIDWKLCNNCGECVKACPAEAIRLLGENMSVEAVIQLVEEDSSFHFRSGGGITVGGGEPAFQSEFVSELLEECRRRGIDTALETSGFARWSDLESVCRHANLIFYDIKHMDSREHKALTGVANELIMDNLNRLSRTFPATPIVARTPVVPGCNDSRENIRATAKFLAGIKSAREYNLLPYHGFGEPKYRQLGRQYALDGLKPPSQERIAELSVLAQATWSRCLTVGGQPLR